MNRDHLFGGFRHVKGRGRTATGAVVGDVGRQIGGAYDQAAGAAQYVYGEARDGFEDLRRRAEGAYREARDGYEDVRRRAEHVYHDARDVAGNLIERGSDVYDDAARRGDVYRKKVVRYTVKHPPEALLAAAGFGFLLALIVTRRPLL